MSNSKSDYYVYTHSNPDIQTLGDFVGQELSIGSGLSIADLLNYEDETGLANVDRLGLLYTASQHTQFDSLLEQVQNSNVQKQNPDSTTSSTDSSGNTTDVAVQNTPQQNSEVKDTSNPALALKFQTLITGVNLNPSPLSRGQQAFISLIPDLRVQKLFALFIQQIQAAGYIVQVNSTVRTLAAQQGLADDNAVASKGFSYHIPGLAIDIQILNSFGITVAGGYTTDAQSSTVLAAWNATGVPQIAKNLGLTWGGSNPAFSNGHYDFVHFDARVYFDINTAAYMTALAKSTSDTSAATVTATDDVNSNETYQNLPLNIGTVLTLPFAKLDRDLLSSLGTEDTTQTSTFEAFLARELFFLLTNPKYQRTFIPKHASFGTVKEIYPYMSVWIWSRALSIDVDGNYNHKILNITPYIGALNTTVGDNGGNFNIDISAITAEIGANGWQVEKGTKVSDFTQGKDYVAQGFLHYEEGDFKTPGGTLKRSRHFFEKVFQQNDLVFIKFEKLKIEDALGVDDNLEFISVHDLPNQVFDMIGLIDTPSISTSPASAAVSITLAGRDLVKLIIEDGVYFYPADFISGGIFGNQPTGAANQRLNRFGANGEILSRFQTMYKDIHSSLKWIINSLANIQICPTDLFDSYANGIDLGTGTVIDKRERAYQLTNSQQSQIQDNQREIQSNRDDAITQIQQVQKANNVSIDTANEVESLIEGWISENYKSIVYTQGSGIQSWSAIGQLAPNQIPIELADLLYLRNRVWVDNNIQGRPVIGQSLVCTTEMEQLFKDVNLSSIGLDSVFYQLRRISQNTYNANLYYDTFYTFFDILADITAQNSTLTSPSAIASNAFVPLADQINADYLAVQTVLGTNPEPIKLLILNTEWSDLATDEKNIFNSIYQIVTQQNSISNQAPPSPSLQPTNGIWQIVSLVVDDSVKNRLLADASIGNENGSLINAIRKICQDPFCEFFTDTYGSKFYFIARKRPFDKVSLLSWLNGQVVYEEVDPVTQNPTRTQAAQAQKTIQGTKGEVQPVIISINETDVISDSLEFSQESYSWYRLQLQNLISGSDADMSFAYLKAVFFNEYADIFGSKPLDVTSSYIPYQNIVDKNHGLSTNYFIKQGIYDLQYLIESNCYLPFTRQGTIVMNGDRRIKKGTWVRLESTSELFYVDAISHSFVIDEGTIDRTTTLQVSRGMVEQYIKGAYAGKVSGSVPRIPSYAGDLSFNPNNASTQTESFFVSYFNIINLEIDNSVFENVNMGYAEVSQLILSKWQVNKQVFNFFLKKLQFAKSNKEIENVAGL